MNKKLNFILKIKKNYKYFLYLLVFIIIIISIYFVIPKFFNYTPKLIQENLKKNSNINIKNISNVNYTDKYTVLWVRNNCCFVLSDTKSKEIQYKNLLSIFENTASITDQTGGWLVLNLEGDDCRFLLEKLITIDLDNFDNHHVIRTSIASINCFIVCETKFQRYNLICPTSYFATIKSRLIKLITLLQ